MFILVLLVGYVCFGGFELCMFVLVWCVVLGWGGLVCGFGFMVGLIG